MSINKLMESKKNLILIGMMGSGKSTIGSILAKKLELEFIDIDKKIEEKEGVAIATIFKKKGESYFRQIEEKISIDLLNSNKKIISLGGGGFVNKNIQKIVLRDHVSFWLNWKNSTLINRIKNSKKRPLAISFDVKQLEKLIIDRSQIYSKAKFKIYCENLNKNEIINKIINIYEKI